VPHEIAQSQGCDVVTDTMVNLFLILAVSLAMVTIALMAAILFFLIKESVLKQISMPLVSFAAGALFSSAFFHLIPSSILILKSIPRTLMLTVLGFCLVFAIEQFLPWHHTHSPEITNKTPSNPSELQTSLSSHLVWLLLVADSLHNLLGGLAIGTTLTHDTKAGLAAALAAALHEMPQELGDMAVFIACGLSKPKALYYNLLSSLTFPLGALLSWFAEFEALPLLIPIAAGNFIYIAATDLIPEVKKNTRLPSNILHFFMFVFGVGLMLALG
jgi:zinc and cadmium transporter